MYKNGVIRLTSLLVLLFNINRISVLGQGVFNVKEENDKALYGYSFLNITETRMERCLAKCLENCLCMSFQMCEQEECQLCSSDKEKSPSAFRERKGCTYYAFQKDWSKVKTQQCQKSCFTGINCCTTSKPCMNNGICEPVASPTDTTTRFKCKCPPNYTGNLCQYPSGKSCRDYLNGNRVSGKYKIMDNNKKPFEVFCDFNLISGMAWTLIQSYQFQNKDKFQKPLFDNDPVNEETPAWDSYRLSKSRMESIQQDSKKWRITCQYDTDGRVVYRDYVRGTNDKIDILTEHDECIEMERVNIRGEECKSCTILVVQRVDMTFHLKSFYRGCSFPTTEDEICGTVDNFGFYACTNPAHRCSATETSTTQIWFGGR